MDLYEVVTKLVGPITPIGETNADEQRFKNLDALTTLLDQLMTDVGSTAWFAGRHEASMRKAGKHAEEFVRDTPWAEVKRD